VVAESAAASVATSLAAALQLSRELGTPTSVQPQSDSATPQSRLDAATAANLQQLSGVQRGLKDELLKAWWQSVAQEAGGSTAAFGDKLQLLVEGQRRLEEESKRIGDALAEDSRRVHEALAAADRSWAAPREAEARSAAGSGDAGAEQWRANLPVGTAALADHLQQLVEGQRCLKEESRNLREALSGALPSATAAMRSTQQEAPDSNPNDPHIVFANR